MLRNIRVGQEVGKEIDLIRIADIWLEDVARTLNETASCKRFERCSIPTTRIMIV
jgi:DNA-binding IclR family transcriptional regulator